MFLIAEKKIVAIFVPSWNTHLFFFSRHDCQLETLTVLTNRTKTIWEKKNCAAHKSPPIQHSMEWKRKRDAWEKRAFEFSEPHRRSEIYRTTIITIMIRNAVIFLWTMNLENRIDRTNTKKRHTIRVSCSDIREAGMMRHNEELRTYTKQSHTKCEKNKKTKRQLESEKRIKI